MDGIAVGPDRGRLDSITGARFIAAFMVFLFHIATINLFVTGGGVAKSLTFATKSAGTIGVSFFFVLSGFVLTWSARPGDTYGGFLRRRLVKVFPNHVVTFCLAMLLFAASATPPARAVLNLLLLHAWVPNPETFLSVNGPSWSLSCELLFYATFPLLLSATGRIRASRLGWWAGGVVATIVALPSLALLLPAAPVFGDDFDGTILGGQSEHRLWLLYIFPLARLLDFVLGMLMARIVLAGRLPRVRVAPAALLTVAGYTAGLFVPLLYTVDAVTVVPLALLIAALTAGEARGERSLLGRPLMRRLGEISFAFYLVHAIVLTFLRAMVGFDRQLSPLPGLLFAIVGLVLSIGVAALLYTYVERAAMRRWARPRRRDSGEEDPVTGGPDEKVLAPGLP